VRPPTRKLWLDWERGLAVLVMVEVHTHDAWLAPAAPRGAVHDVLRMVGGFAAPSFLFMAGLSQVLGDTALERRGVSPPDRRRRAFSRALRLLVIAYAFRGAEYLFGGMYQVPGGWRDLLRVDILNVIAVGLAGSALLLHLRGRAFVAGASAVALAIALSTPVVAAWEHGPSRILDYLYATYPRANFTLFNWAGFLFAGSAVGRLTAARERPLALLAVGAALFTVGWWANRLPAFYAHQDFWRTSPSWWAMRLGGVVALTGLLQRLPPASDGAMSWLRTLGRHSLLGYVVSVELTYGRLSTPLHRRLSLGAVLAAIVAMTVATWALSVLADRVRSTRRPPAGESASPAP
jgi:uncharacterized membrane protein